jgi:hypothetical protein
MLFLFVLRWFLWSGRAVPSLGPGHLFLFLFGWLGLFVAAGLS